MVLPNLVAQIFDADGNIQDDASSSVTAWVVALPDAGHARHGEREGTMSEDTGTGSLGNASGVPAIRTFQLDSTSSGQLASAVNLFRGDVNIPRACSPSRVARPGTGWTSP